MTRHSFGGTTADFVQQVDNTGIVHAGNGITCSFFTAQSGGTAVIDLQDMNGNPITTVSADANGGIPQFMGPDDGSSALWVSGGGANRQLMAATDIPSRVNTLEISGGGGGTAGVTSINGKTGVIAVLAPADVGLGNVNNTSDAAKPLSTASTNALAAKADLVGGLIPSSQLPAVSLVKPTPVATQAAMLALTATDVQPGDVAVVANDPGRGSYMLNAADPSVLGNWLLLTSPTDAVTSVNGHTGVVVLAAADVSADASGAAATAQATAIAASEPVLKVVGPKSANYTGLPGEFASFTLASASLVFSLPNAPADNIVSGVKIVALSGSNTLTINCQGTDVIDLGGGVTTTTLRLLGQAKTFKYKGGVWTTLSDDLPLTQLDTRYPLASTVGQASGIASLDATSRVPIAQLPISSTSLILPTTGKPANAVGNDGDQALDRAARMVYAKAAGAWDNGSYEGAGAVDVSKQGCYGWTVDPATAGNNMGMGSGVLYLVRFTALLSGTIGNFGLAINTVGATLTAGGSWVGLYDTGQIAAGVATLMGASADQTSNFGGVTAAFKVALSGANSHTPTVVAGQDYFAAFLSSGTTPPKLQGSGSLFGTMNLGMASSGLNYRGAYVNGAGLTLPNTVSAFSQQMSTTPIAVLLP